MKTLNTKLITWGASVLLLAATETTLRGQPAAYYPFNGNDFDESGNSNNPTIFQASLTADRFGNPNRACSFGGSNYVVIPDSPSLEITGQAITIAAWVYPTNFWPGGKSDIVRKMTHTASEGGYVFGVREDGAFQFGGYFDSGEWQDPGTAPGAITTNQWTHVAVTYDGQLVRYYRNGLPAGSRAFSGHLLSSTQPLVIGKITPDSDGEFFYGKIDALRIYSRVLSASEMVQIAAPNISDGLVAHYTFDGDVRDSSGNTNDGTMFGATLAADRFGIQNRACSFDGSRYILVSDSSSLQITGQAISIAAWLYPTNFWPGGRSDIVRKMTHPASQGGYVFGIREDGAFQFGGYFDSGEWQDPGTSPGAVATNQWTHVAMTYDGQQVRYYRNGLLVGSTAFSGQLLSSTQSLVIGRITSDSDGEFFYGKIDELRIFDRVLGASEIAQILTPNLNDGLVAHYTFDGNARDSSGNTNDGTVFGATLTTDRFGNPNSAYSFNGASQYIAVSNSSSLSFTSAVSFGAWVLPQSPGVGGRYVIKKGVYNQNGTFNLTAPSAFVSSQTAADAWVTLAGDNVQTVTSSNQPAIGQWCHLAGTYDGTNLALFVNGELSATKPASGALQQNDLPLYFGGDFDNSGTYFIGAIDEVRIYNRALIGPEVAQLAGVSYANLPISLQRSGSGSILTWASGTLLFANDLQGPWTPLTGVTSPLFVTPSGTKGFYRVKQ